VRSRFRQLLDWLHWPELKREPPPRAAVAVVLVGLLACAVAAYAQTIKSSSEAAYLEWVQEAPVPDSEPVEVPGGEQKMKLTEGLIRSTGTNVSEFALFQVAAVLQIEAEAPIGDARVLCSIAASHGAEIGQTYLGLRALYPRSSEDGIYKQEVPEKLSIDFSSHGHEYAILEVADLPSRFTTEKGVKLEWGRYEKGTEHLKYFIAGGKPKNVLRLPFNAVWKTTDIPKATISCTLQTSAGKSTVTTKAALKHVSPPIDEEAEEANRELVEEEETAEDEEAGGETE
jgi:hypothetical protein